MRNRIESLLKEIGVTAYRLAQDTGITKNTVYSLKNNPSQFPSGDVFDRIIKKYGVTPNQIVEYYEESKND